MKKQTPKEAGSFTKAAMGLLAGAGGKATLKKYGPNHFRDLGRKGMKKRWAKIRAAKKKKNKEILGVIEKQIIKKFKK